MCVCVSGGREGSCQGNPPNSSFLCLWKSLRRGSNHFPGVPGSGLTGSKRRAPPRRKPGPLPPSASQLLARSSGSFKASHLGLSRRSSDGSGGEGAACAVSTFSNAHHPRALCSQPYPRRCVPMTVTVAMTVAAAAPRTRSAPGTSLAPSL